MVDGAQGGPADGLEWRLLAACRGRSAGEENLWFVEGRSRRHRELLARAVAICGTCPVREECLSAVMRAERAWTARYGIFGGLTPEQRQGLSTLTAHRAEGEA